MEISDFDLHFECANSNYSRNLTSRQVSFLTNWYYEQTGEKLIVKQCSSCFVDLLKRCSEEYNKIK